MTISYPIAAPAGTLGVESVQLGPRAIVAVSRSPFTGDTQAQVHQGQLLSLTVNLTRGLRVDLEPWISFLMKLNGRQGTFLFGDPMNPEPLGEAETMPGTPLVAGASQTGQTLDVDNAPAGIASWLRAGTWLQLGTAASARLHKVIEDADTDGGGAATLTLWPSIRVAPADNDPIVLFNPQGVWRLASNVMPYDISQALIYGLQFSAIAEV